MGFPLFSQASVAKRRRRSEPTRLAGAAAYHLQRKFVEAGGQRQTVVSAYRVSDGKLDHEFVLLGWVFGPGDHA